MGASLQAAGVSAIGAISHSVEAVCGRKIRCNQSRARPDGAGGELYIHAYRTRYDDEAISVVLQRPLTKEQRFSFREFVTFLDHINLRRCNPHHRVQVTSVERHVLFGIKPRRIIKVEEGLMPALGELERSLGLPATDFSSAVFRSSHHTVRAVQHEPAADLMQHADELPPASAFYDDDLRTRVMQLYAEDYRHYGYRADAAGTAGVIGQRVVCSNQPQAQL